MRPTTKMTSPLLIALGMSALMVLAGCETTQSVVDIRQHPSQDVTIIHTVEQGGFDAGGHRFWHCVRESDQLLCDLVCGDDLSCPQQPGMIRATRSPAAQLGITRATAAPDAAPHEPAQEPEEELSTQRPDQGDESQEQHHEEHHDAEPTDHQDEGELQ